jgi:hypothetical protein
MSETLYKFIAGDDPQRIVTPTNPLIINSAVGNYGEVIIEGGFVQVVVPAPGIEFTSLSKKS